MESTWRRALTDTDRFRQSARSFWAFEVVGAAIFGILGGYLGFLLLPAESDRQSQWSYPAVGGAIGVVGGLTFAFTLIFIWNLFRAPYRQRDEARQNLEKLEKLREEQGPRDFSLVWRPNDWFLRTANGRANYWEDESDGLGLILAGSIVVNTLRQIQVESVSLEMGGTLLKSDWNSEGFYTSEERDINVEIPLDTTRGKRTAMVSAVVDGQPYKGESYTVNLPQGKRVFTTGDPQI